MLTTEIQLGTEFAGHQIVGVIGRGGMSVVYLGEHLRLGRPAAIKVLAPALANDESFRGRFLRESKLAAQLDHPSVVPVFDAGESDGLLYIAMRYIDGSDLGAMLSSGGALSLGESLFVVDQLASALDAAHAAGLVHRDVKPANVLIAKDSNRVYLSDFGIVKQTSGAPQTATGYFLGTFEYAAPEQIEGAMVDRRTDVYSLACVLYACLTGASPYHGNTEGAVVRAKLFEPPPRLGSTRPDLPQALDAVLASAMAHDPDDRYGSCGEFAAAARMGALGRATAPAPDAEPPLSARVPAAAPTVLDPAAAPAERPAEPQTKPWWKLEGRRRLVALGFGIVALILVGGVLAALVGDAGESEAGEATATGTTAAAASHEAGEEGHTVETGATTGESDSSGDHAAAGGFPDAIEEEFLLAHVPEHMRDTCVRARVPDGAAFLRSVSCRDTTGGHTVVFSRAHSGDALRSYFLHQVEHAEIEFPTPERCAGTTTASHEWVRIGRSGHAERSSKQAEGRVLCYTDAGRALVAWTDTPSKIFASASADASRRGALYTWWQTRAGPGEELAHEEEHELGTYPDAIEEELLLDHVPADVRGKCKRAESPSADVFLRSVECPQEQGSTRTVQYSFAHSGPALRTYFTIVRVTAAGLEVPTAGNCATGTDAARPWTMSGARRVETVRGGSGALFCWQTGGEATLEWTDVPTLVYARAARPAGARRALYEWWQRHAGPTEGGSEESGHGG